MDVVVRWTAVDDDHRRDTARHLLRRTVAETHGADVDDVTVHQQCPRCGGPHGRPSVRIAGAAGPHVSMSYAAGIAVVAVASAAVGVDIEPTARTDSARASGIDLRTWVRTEALLKATGHGLEVDPSLVEITDSDSGPRLTRWDGPGRRPVVRLADLAIADGYLAAIASLGRRPLCAEVREASEGPPAAATM